MKKHCPYQGMDNRPINAPCRWEDRTVPTPVKNESLFGIGEVVIICTAIISFALILVCMFIFVKP